MTRKEIKETLKKKYDEKEKLEAEAAAIDKRRLEITQEYGELRAKCTNSYGYAKTRERREELDKEFIENGYKHISILSKIISIDKEISDLVKKIYFI